jgi:NAD(P)-dependent dehydrogenase (short-subunit alcohol dehydrogenase family)
MGCDAHCIAYPCSFTSHERAPPHDGRVPDTGLPELQSRIDHRRRARDRRAMAELFAREGAKVVLCSRTKDQLPETVSAIASAGGQTTARVADIGIAREAEALVRLAVKRYGLRSSGHSHQQCRNLRTSGSHCRVPAPNLGSGLAHQSVRAVRDIFCVSGRRFCHGRTRHGHDHQLVFFRSRRGQDRWGAYAVSKFGVEGLSQVIADELRPAGVCIVTFNPGARQSAMRAEAYPSENPGTVRASSNAARALLRLTANLSPDLSGEAFDQTNLP